MVLNGFENIDKIWLVEEFCSGGKWCVSNVKIQKYQF